MKSRIITGAVASVIALVVLLLLPPFALNIAMAFICALAMWEVLVVTKFVDHRGLMAAAIVFAAITPFFLMIPQKSVAMGIVVIYVVFLAVVQIMYHQTLKVERTGFVFFISIIVPVSLSCLAYIRNIFPEHGLFYVFLTLVMPWLCDMGAYFVGTFLGKHKLCPGISPKKTVEGLIGGILISVGASVFTGWLYQLLVLDGMGLQVNYWQIALLSLLMAPLSVIGDLFASIIKRQCSVKDFGNIMPGHGGVMDRFDSLLFVAPIVFIVLLQLPLIS